MSEFCKKKGIKKEFSVARTPQQNGVAERRNRTLIEAARTMLADSKLPTIFWAEAVNTACYVQNMALVVKPYNKTPYELFRGRTPALSFMRHLGVIKAFRVYNIRTRKVEENLHIRFLEDKPIIASDGPKWLFDIDVLTKSMNYVPVVVESPMKNSTQDVNTARPSINTASTSVNTGSLNINVVSPTVTTALLEATHVDFFGLDLGGFTTWQKSHWIEAIRLFLAYASFKDFVVYQMDVKSAFLYGKIEEEVYVCQPLGFEDPEFPDRVYKIDKTLSYALSDEKFMQKMFQMSSIGELTFFLGLQVTQKDDGIFISQDKYMDEILKKFGFSTMKTASTPMETSKPLMKDENAEDVDSESTPKVSHLHAVKRIFRYLKGQPKLGLWYPKDSPFDLEAYTDSDYAGASLD
ncbi:retrovirus-related pol polyprotein from transposon TNT 1-94 [Tanacetum coccineum]